MTKLNCLRMKTKRKVKALGKSKAWAIVVEMGTKYLNITPSIATIYKGHVWPIGISIKWLYFGVSLTYIGED